MKTLSRYVSLISVTGLLSGGALVAQTSGTSGATGTNDANRSGMSTTPPRNSSSPEVSGGTTGSNPTNDPSGPHQPTSAGSTRSTARTSNNGYDTSGSASSDVSGAGASAAAGISRSRNTFTGTAFSSATDPLSSSIQSADYNTRTQLANDVEQRLDSQKESAKSMRSEGKHLQGQPKADFKAAYDELETREKDLKRSVRNVRSAGQEKWESARSELASNYQAYLAALTRVQAQVSTNANFPTSSPSSTTGSTPSQDRTTSGSAAPGLTPSTSP